METGESTQVGQGGAPTGKANRPAKPGLEMSLHGLLLAAAIAGVGYDVVVLDGPSPVSLAVLLALAALLVIRIGLLLRRNRRLFEGFTLSDDFKTQLLRFISHEIANPLSPLKLQAGLLRQGASDPDKAWKAVDRSIARLESLSRDVRLMALAETRRIVQSTTVADLVPRVAAAAQAHQAVAAQRGLRMRADLPPQPLGVPIDGERFDQVVDNLLSNALKFTPRGGVIDVRLFRSPGGWAVFEVQDSGAGMTSEQQARLFSAFGRPQGTTTPGLGLGLYLCKAIVDGHGGRIMATSAGAGQGSRFRVELPPAAPEARSGSPPGPPPAYQPAVHAEHEVPAGRPADLPV